ncbi:MAG: serine hydrolase domain-containing protein [Brevundimonas sp.]
MLIMKLLGVGATLLAGPGAADRPIQAPDPFVAEANAIVEAAYPADGPGAVVVITKGGRTVYATSRGMADLDEGRPLSSQTVFRLGSLTKSLTAATILQLVEEGRIGLDDPLSHYLPSYPAPAGSATVRQLLNHTSGIASYNEIPGWMEANAARPFSTPELVGVFRDLPVRSEPGQAWAYSNSNYVLLGAIMEAVTRGPWHRTVTDRLSGPLGLRTLGYGPELEASGIAARGYTITAGGRPELARSTDPSVRHAAAGLAGSAGDLARWTRALHRGEVITADLHAQMIAPTLLPDGQPVPYGFGMALGDVRGQDVLRHDGRVSGFSNESLYLPTEDIVIVVLANSDRPATSPALLGRRLAALAIGKPYRRFTRVPVDPEAVARDVGVYQSGSAPPRRFFLRDSKVFMGRDGAPDREVYPAGERRYFYPDSFTWFQIEETDSGAVMRLYQDDGPQPEVSARETARP